MQWLHSTPLPTLDPEGDYVLQGPLHCHVRRWNNPDENGGKWVALMDNEQVFIEAHYNITMVLGIVESLVACKLEDIVNEFRKAFPHLPVTEQA